MTTGKLSVEPRFHHYVEHGEASEWVAAISPFGPVVSFADEIGDEQQRIEAEGRVNVVVDLKR